MTERSTIRTTRMRMNPSGQWSDWEPVDWEQIEEAHKREEEFQVQSLVIEDGSGANTSMSWWNQMTEEGPKQRLLIQRDVSATTRQEASPRGRQAWPETGDDDPERGCIMEVVMCLEVLRRLLDPQREPTKETLMELTNKYDLTMDLNKPRRLQLTMNGWNARPRTVEHATMMLGTEDEIVDNSRAIWGQVNERQLEWNSKQKQFMRKGVRLDANTIRQMQEAANRPTAVIQNVSVEGNANASITGVIFNGMEKNDE